MADLTKVPLRTSSREISKAEKVAEQLLLAVGGKEERQAQEPVDNYELPTDAPLSWLNEIDNKKFYPAYQRLKDVPICDLGDWFPINDAYLADVHRVYYTPAFLIPDKEAEPYTEEEPKEKRDMVFFPAPGEEKELTPTQQAKMFDPDSDELLYRILAARNNFAYSRTILDREKTTHAELCRSEQKEKDGSYRLWVHKRNRVLTRRCEGSDEVRLNPLPNIKLSDPEKLKLVAACNLATPQYCFANDWSGKVYITGHLPTVELCEERIESSGLFTAARAEEIIDDMEQAVTGERDDVFYKRMFFGSAALNTILFGALLYNAHRSRQLQQRLVEKVDEKPDPKKFIVDESEIAKKDGYSKLVIGPEEETFLERAAAVTNKRLRTHVTFHGMTGEGKDELRKEFFHRAVKGDYKHLKGYGALSIDATSLEAAAAKYSGLPAQVIQTVVEIGRTGKYLIGISEAQMLAGMGVAEGHKASALDMLKTAMEDPDYPSRLVFTTDDPSTLRQNGAVNRRTTFLKVPPTEFESTFKILVKRTTELLGGRGVTITQEVLRTIVHTAQFRDGSSKAQALEILDELASNAEIRGMTEIGKSDVVKLAALDAECTPEAIEQLLRILEKHPNLSQGSVKLLVAAIEAGQDANQLLELLEKIEKHGTGKKGPKGGGPKGGGTPPPAAPAGESGGAEGAGSTREGGPSSARSEGPADRSANRVATEMAGGDSSSSRGGLRMTPRFGETLERVGGFTVVTGLLSVVTAAEHYKAITPEQKGLIDWSMIGAGFAADASFAAILLGGIPGAWAGHGLATYGADATGFKILRKGEIGNKIVGVAGGVAGFGASNWALKRYLPRHWNRFTELTRAGTTHTARNVRDQIGQVGMAMEDGLAQTWQNVRTGLQIYGKEVVSVASGYLATARAGATALGESLATGGLTFANVASLLVTPIFTINGLDTWGNKIPNNSI